MSSLKQKLNRRVNADVYRLNGQAATLSSGQEGDPIDVWPIIETNADQEDGAPFVPLTMIAFTARFNAFTIEDENIKLMDGQVLTLAAPYLGHAEFRLTSDPIPTGRKGTQFMVSIAPSSPTTIGAAKS